MRLNSDHRSAIKTITDLEGDLESYTSSGRQEISQIEELIHHTEKTISNAGAVSGSDRFTDYQGSISGVGLHVLKEMNDDRREAVIDEAKEARDAMIKKDMNQDLQGLLNEALTDLKSGKIDENE